MDVGSEQDYDAYVDTVLELVNMQNAYESDPNRRVSPDAAVAYAEDAFDFEIDLGHADETTYVDGENLMYGLDDNGTANLSNLEPLLDGFTNAVVYHKRQQSIETPNYGVSGCNDVNREMDDILMLAGAIRRSRFPGASVTVLSNDGYKWMTMETDVEFENFDGPVDTDGSVDPDGSADPDSDDGDGSVEEPYVVVGPDGLDQAKEPRVIFEYPEPKQDPVPLLLDPTVNDPRTKYLFAATAIAAIVAGFIWA
jgi:hypothetical protein